MENLTFEEIKQLFIETRRQLEESREQFKETREQMKETDKKFQELAKEREKNEILFKNIHDELGGIGKSNGEVAEQFFYSALENSMQIGKLKFDYIASLKQKRNKIEGQYDIVLYNDYKVLIVEVKYNFRKRNLLEFYKNIKNFKLIFPEYKEYKIYGAIAGMTIEAEAIEEAKEFGFFILTQNNQNIQILNDKNFEPNTIK